MRTDACRGGDPETDALGGGGELAANADDLAAELGNVAADPRADLDDRRVQLVFELVAQRRRGRFD